MGTASTEDAYCLKWNDFHTSITASFSDLRNESDLLDAVIVCEGQQLRAHRLVLSACSGVFRQLFRMSSITKSDHPVVLLWDVKAEDLKLLMNFMYEGQVNVAQEHLTNFLALAERLQVRGLTSSDANKNSAMAAAAQAAGASLPPVPQQQHSAMPNNRAGPTTPVSAIAKSSVVSPASGRRLRSSPMGLSTGLPPTKRLRPTNLPSLTDTSSHEGDLDDLPPPPPVKQELKVDESSTVFSPSNSTLATPPQATSFSGGPGSNPNFNPFYAGSNANNSNDDFDSSAGPSSLPGGYEMEPGSMLEEGSKGSLYYEYDDDLDEVPDDDDDADGERAWQREQAALHAAASSGEAMASGGRIPGCPYCGKELRNMTRHIEDVHCPVEIACQLCGKICTSRNKLRTHMAQVCNKRFLST